MTQTFYTTYFQPEALLVGDLLIAGLPWPSGGAVTSAQQCRLEQQVLRRAACLKRMDGQEGGRCSLGAALANINGLCPPGARLQSQGAWCVGCLRPNARLRLHDGSDGAARDVVTHGDGYRRITTGRATIA
jgi:hypothetical protein